MVQEDPDQPARLDTGQPAAYGPTAEVDLRRLTEREFLALVAKRVGMYVTRADLRGVTNFLHGYDAAAGRHAKPVLDGFAEWLKANYVGRHNSFGWPGYVQEIALPGQDFGVDRTPEQEKHVLDTLFALLDKFLAEQETAT
ncbi:hypothetical protein [Nocardia tengchongensis]|uniref:hypothetical protein n=1 Tax=Nocardia tengchongensis TaxID=2055889 RepID=UPI0036B5D4D9